MVTRIAVFLVLLCTACQSGLIPCPEVKTVRSRRITIYKSFHESSGSLSSDARIHARYSKGSDDRMIQSVSVEEWDCPRPGQKKYMPKSVKENIRKNLKKVTKDSGNKADSVSIR
ncbi:MAG TPA: hypothetical protein VL443_10845 [Cyclobacteriaceae bacterium]|jgi:hypothetical protein|nr:hypothetical protein [Cyclobacteriaceae bacterium]